LFIDVSEKVVVITGAARGIGRALAITFSKEKAKVIINYNKSKKEATQLLDEISTYNKNCMIIRADITNPQDVSQMYLAIIKKYKRVDILINNAGICDDALLQKMSVNQWKEVLDTNLTGTFLCCREFSKIMMKQHSGKIVNVASLKGQEGSYGQVNYSVAKGGIITLTKSLAKELGKYGVSINAICPGFVLTDLNLNNNEKRLIAEQKSVLKLDSALQDCVNFIIVISSEMFMGISGRVFNLDSRIN
jgi:3-oxoacyl-[acyl-carrier protein] reductase